MRDNLTYLQHIMESIQKIEKYLNTLTKDQFLENDSIQDAVIRRFEIIGEATKNLSKTFRNRYPEVPWRLMAGTRDVFIHDYFGIDLDSVWDAAKEDLPGLKKQLEKIIKAEK